MSIYEFAIKKNTWSNVYIKYIISYLIQAITVIVVAVPEGLPLAVTLALAFAVRVIYFLFFNDFMSLITYKTINQYILISYKYILTSYDIYQF